MSATLATVQTAYASQTTFAGQADFAATAANPARSASLSPDEALPEPGTDSTRVTLSPQARALLQQEATVAQSANAQASSSTQLQFPDAALMAQLRAAGIPQQPAFMLKVDPVDHHVTVLGARPDAARIAAMINTVA
ncbi:hypothetical protein [Paludibacterium sp. B53371]|uniref:hypothetical protein n=1 Tax=Paludibacterium sp. B53371 TaxID=2806263 RepID=UPI001C03C25A|nr:hypothetical protein [Paludibacterium sp. B53371]